MILRLSLTNFRNYVKQCLEFSPGINLFTGENGQGKTNILEAVFYLLSGKSLRVQREQELVRWGEKSFSLAGEFRHAAKEVKLESSYDGQLKFIRVNGVPCRRLSDFVGLINVIFFAPDDLTMIKGGPGERRRFLDLHIAQLKPGYVSLLNSYNKALLQKSSLLKAQVSPKSKQAQIELWNEQLLLLGTQLMQLRWEYAHELNSLAQEVYANIAWQRETMEVAYLPLGEQDLDSALALYPRLLAEKIPLEIERRVVLAGPHRDDLAIYLDGRNSRRFASQGQQRSIVLGLKLAQVEIMAQHRDEYPILLLDDVLSELDRFRRQYLLEFMASSPVQTLITSALGETAMAAGARYIVQQGQIRRVV